MKKIFTLAAIAAVALSFTMTSCSKSAADYVKETKELSAQIEEATKAGDTEKVKELTEELSALNKEITEKTMNDPEFMKEYAAEILK